MVSHKNSAKNKTQSESETSSATPRYYTYGSAHQRAARWIWIGAASFAVAIFALWGWSIKQKMIWFSWAQTPESQLASQAKTDWDKAFADQKKEQNENEKEAVKKQMEKIINQLIKRGPNS